MAKKSLTGVRLASAVISPARSATNTRTIRSQSSEASSSTLDISQVQVTTSSEAERAEKHAKQIAALAMRGPRPARAQDSWRKTVGKYSEDSPLNRMLERGHKIRESERDEQ